MIGKAMMHTHAMSGVRWDYVFVLCRIEMRNHSRYSARSQLLQSYFQEGRMGEIGRIDVLDDVPHKAINFIGEKN